MNLVRINIIRSLICVLFLTVVFSCKNKSYSERMLESLNVEMAQHFMNMNTQLINNIELYESKINFTDTITKGKLNKLNTNNIVDNFWNSREIYENESLNDKFGSLLIENQGLLIDSLIEPFLYQYHTQKSELESLKNLNSVNIKATNELDQIIMQVLKNEVFYNYVFQFLFRHKLEEELTTSYYYPFVVSDIEKDNGINELTLRLSASSSNDLQEVTVAIRTNKLSKNKTLLKINKFNEYVLKYDSRLVDDTIQINVETINKLNENTDLIIKKYSTKK